jgi:DNA-binding MarR family transcriptional regulator
MANTIPKWVQERYAKLWNKYQENGVTYEDIQDTLKMDDRNVISVFLNELKKAGWIDVQLSEKDSRQRVYILRTPNEVMAEIRQK